MTEPLNELVARMEEAAKVATPGPWMYDDMAYVFTDDGEPKMVMEVRGAGWTASQDENGRFVALSNPANILRLIAAYRAECEQKEALMEALRIVRDIRMSPEGSCGNRLERVVQVAGSALRVAEQESKSKDTQ